MRILKKRHCAIHALYVVAVPFSISLDIENDFSGQILASYKIDLISDTIYNVKIASHYLKLPENNKAEMIEMYKNLADKQFKAGLIDEAYENYLEVLKINPHHREVNIVIEKIESDNKN